MKEAHLKRHFGKKDKRNLKRFAPFFYIGIAILIVALILITSSMNLVQNVESRALAEVQSTVLMQASACEEHIDEQYQALRLVGDMLENGRHFGSEKIQPTLNSMVRIFGLCAFCLADKDGNTTDHHGNNIGSCSDRAYFQEIISGNSTHYCEYLASPKTTSEPRVIFSMPAYDGEGNVRGVLFCSKEVSVLEDSLFLHNTLFDSASGIFICSDSGEVIAANENGYGYLSKESDSGGSNLYTLSEELANLSGTGEAGHVEVDGKHCFAAYAKLSVEGWGIYCLVDEESAAKTYHENQARTGKTIAAIALAFTVCIIYIVALGWTYIRRKDREADIIKRYNENYKNILSETHCAVVEYDTDTKTVTTIQENFGDLKLASLNGTVESYEKYKRVHPEFDFEELEAEIDIARKNGKTCSFETILAPDPDRFYWLKTKLIPITDEDGEMTRVYCVLFDVSDLHHEHEMALDTYAKIPGAVHRHILTEPIHVNYYSDGLCKMLGYSRAEIDDLMGPEYRYSLLICEEDRPKYVAFLNELARTEEGTQSCEYRLLCKGGSLLDVSDTTDAKRSSSGVVYGYSVVTDLRKYRDEQQQLKQELAQTRDQLAQSRVKNANSQMQPHFLYNALSSIREIVLEDPEYAADLIYDFTTHLRACVRSMSSDARVSFAQELENIRAYVNIEKMRFGDRLTVEYNCPETDFEIIPLSIQPLVENAVRHGVFDRGAAGGRVVVSSAREDDCYIVCVEDNGVGFDYKQTMQEVEEGTRDSSGLANLIFRLATLLRADVSVDSKIGFGTKVTVTIPVSDEKEREQA